MMEAHIDYYTQQNLVAQLYGEFSNFFPENAVEYFVSYYDYYQPEAYMPASDIYIEKTFPSMIGQTRLRATTSLFSGRRDIVIVASVSCIYGMGNPPIMKTVLFQLRTRVKPFRVRAFDVLVICFIIEPRLEFNRDPQVKGDTVDINPPYMDFGYRIFWDEIEEWKHYVKPAGIGSMDNAAIFPANRRGAPKRPVAASYLWNSGWNARL